MIRKKGRGRIRRMDDELDFEIRNIATRNGMKLMQADREVARMLREMKGKTAREIKF